MERRARQTPKYWEDRSLERLSEAEKNSLPYLRKIQDAYVEAAKSLTEQIKAMYVACYKKDKTFDMAKLHQVVPSGDLEVFYHQLARVGITKELPAQYRGRLNRAEMMNAQAWLEVKKAAVKERDYSDRLYTDTINNAYYRTIFDLSKGLKQDLAFNALDSKTTSKILEAKFYGANYSERIWRSSDKLANSLQGILSRAIASGQSPEKTVRELQERFGVKKYEAQRLVRTETNYFQTQGELESYKELGIKEIVFVATLDMRTSEICREMDGKRIKIAEAKQGTNAPPLHPNCRSTVRPYVGEEWEPRTRAYRDPETGESKHIENMSYSEWKNQFQKEIARAQAREKVRTQTNRLRAIARAVRASGVAAANGAVYYDKSLDSLNTQMVAESKQFVETTLEQLPDVAEWLRDKRGGLAITTSSSQQYKAATAADGSLILLSRNSYSNRQKYILNLIKEINNGGKMFVPAGKHSLYTTAHEFGHVVEAYLTRYGKRSELGKKRKVIESELIDMATGISGKSKKYVKAQMSSYGLTSPQEFFAESFASYILGSNSIWANTMESFLTKKGLIK